MSIRTVTCPFCNAAANVPMAMTNIKCPSCGQVWNVNRPPAAGAPNTEEVEEEEESGGIHPLIFAGAAGACVFVAMIGIFLASMIPGQKKKPEPEQVAAVAAEPEPYREIDLPESVRKRLYWDYRLMVKSSTEKKLMVPKESYTYKQVKGTMQGIVDREVKHFALLHNITEEEVLQVVAEGNAKKWPGSPKHQPWESPPPEEQP